MFAECWYGSRLTIVVNFASISDTEYLSVFSPNTGKYGPEKNPYLDTFHAASSNGLFLKSLYKLTNLAMMVF